ncbi:phenol hydroxylase subunit P4 [Arthrobacter sp. efr-133-TYG-118]|uniref:phenol hydroxylase subunit P4 n=1 Tax=Arthrobacter sp. efr-133-TYG-118 TaxID=3040279 RepID=UPI00254D3199|nr:phenol hydroxylase subunit P4 [Arthrobacter sp. efr-133-TYG-118]
MSVKALYDYEFPSMDRAKLFGEDLLVYVHWEGNPIFCSAVCFRVPKTMPFGEFVTSFVVPWAESDPDFDHEAMKHWRIFDELLDVADNKSLADLGIGHKALLTFAG